MAPGLPAASENENCPGRAPEIVVGAVDLPRSTILIIATCGERVAVGTERNSEAEEIAVIHKSRYEVTLYDLLTAYGRNKSRVEVRSLRIQPMYLYSVEQAIERLRSLVGHMPGWRSLASFLPSDLQDSLMMRSALATPFAASLEMCREGKVQIRQEQSFGPIFLRGADQQAGEGT